MLKISLENIKPRLQHRRELIEKILALKGWDIVDGVVLVAEKDLPSFEWNRKRYFAEGINAE